MAANEKWLAEQKAYVKERNERIAAQFAELRKTHTTRSNYGLYALIAAHAGISCATVRKAVIDAGLVEKRKYKARLKTGGKTMGNELLTEFERQREERHERIREEFKELREEFTTAPNYRIYNVVARSVGVSVPTVRNVVVKAGLVEKKQPYQPLQIKRV